MSRFVPPRTAITIQEPIARVIHSPLGKDAAAPAFYVFNKLAGQKDIEEKRLDILLASLQSFLPQLAKKPSFSLKEALELAGWPKDAPIPLELAQNIESKAVSSGILLRKGSLFTVGSQETAVQNKKLFEHSRERFKTSLQLRLKRGYPALDQHETETIANDIEASLTGYFKTGGLSLATTLFYPNKAQEITIPSSIIEFITEASAQYGDLLKRQAFVTISTDIFASSESAEREYLGRVAQGFFAFHSLGVFGDLARERFQRAKETIWVLDSNIQIPALALGAPTNPITIDCLNRLRSSGIRLFTITSLFDETLDHLLFANKVVQHNGPMSQDVLAGARGDAPYRTKNEFLEGFIRWQAAGNPAVWSNYLQQIIGQTHVSAKAVRGSLQNLGIEVYDFKDWPGFTEFDYVEADKCTVQIVQILKQKRIQVYFIEDTFDEDDFAVRRERKARPEAEAFIVIREEREGNFFMLSKRAEPSPAWFISNTSMLNLLSDDEQPITWRPESFLSFTSTLTQPIDTKSTDHAFEAILWGCAETGLSMINDKTIMNVFGGVIDQATISLQEQKQIYDDTLGQKYGESPEEVMGRVSAANKLLVALQLSNEKTLVEETRRQEAEEQAARASVRAVKAEKKLSEVSKYIEQMSVKKARGKRIARKQQSRSKKKKKK